MHALELGLRFPPNLVTPAKFMPDCFSLLTKNFNIYPPLNRHYRLELTASGTPLYSIMQSI